MHAVPTCASFVASVDPSGHFTSSAIWQYLLKQYHNDYRLAAQAMSNWQNDTEWWDMISTAQAGDTLFGQFDSSLKTMSSEPPKLFLFTFEGEGQDVLQGVSGPGGDFLGEMPSLSEIQQRSQTRTVRGGYGYGQITEKVSYKWMGFIRNIDSRPAFYAPDYAIHQNGFEPWASKWADSAAGGYVGALTGLIFPGLNIYMTTGAGIVAGGSLPTVSDALNMEPYDVNVQIGPVLFNFQLQPTENWTLEDWDTSWR